MNISIESLIAMFFSVSHFIIGFAVKTKLRKFIL